MTNYRASRIAGLRKYVGHEKTFKRKKIFFLCFFLFGGKIWASCGPSVGICPTFYFGFRTRDNCGNVKPTRV